MQKAEEYLNCKNETARKKFKSLNGYGGPSRVFHLDQNFNVIYGKSSDIMHAMLLNAYKTTIQLCLERLCDAKIRLITEITKSLQRQGDLNSEINYKLTGNMTILDVFNGSPKGIKHSIVHGYYSHYFHTFHVSHLTFQANFVQNWVLYCMILSCKGNVDANVLELFMLIRDHFVLISKPSFTPEEIGIQFFISFIQLSYQYVRKILSGQIFF